MILLASNASSDRVPRYSLSLSLSVIGCALV
jgi:hypothetical protein